MKLSPHFDSTEFRCPCPLCRGIEALVAQELLEGLEELRGLLNANLLPSEKETALHINSGARCFIHNQAVGGKASSQHLYDPKTGQACRAVDISSPTRSTRDIYLASVQVEGFKGIGLAPPSQGRRGYVHLDVRPALTVARWGYDDAGKTVALASVLPRIDVEPEV